MQMLLQTLVSQRAEILKSLYEHIGISFISLLIAMLIAIPLAILLRNHRRFGEVGLQIAGIIQTIPSLALLGLLIPLVGIGTVPAVVALTMYAIMPLYQNTYSGLTNIDPNLEEAAVAFGLSKWKRLQRLEFPLALPMIISGIRIALVMIIGTATLAAFIGAGGLGDYIMLGIQQNNNYYLIIGGVLSALLAFIFSGLLKFIGSSKRRIYAGGVVILLMLLGFGGNKIYQMVKPQPVQITIAGKLGSEPEILINMYKDLIKQDNPKAQVTLKPNFGATTFLYKALKRQDVDIYPEFTGTVLEALVKYDKPTPKNPEETYQIAKRELSEQQNMSFLKPMKYENGYDLAVTKEFSKKYHVTKLSDLQRVGDKVIAGFDPDFSNQADGYLGLKKKYNLNFGSVKRMEPSLRYKAIANDRVNLVDGYTTDPQVQQYHLVVLKDDKHFFPPYQGAPLMNESFAKKNPGVVKSLNKLAGKISAEDMQKMNYQVSVKNKKASVVAHDYLVKKGLLK
ncbi:ABC transporter permease/substrate-binding protein [Companilactobacillus kimchii]|uniref:ABC proline glycine betaine transporter, permease and substrate binding protein n=2 Tax=Companilactobacillus kimchii TaxID=2801452 RepID=A0ABR5NVX5_9LACO|nr:ABC transporter permease/substrate-binding protein [Companilactobacillus kimchii]KAE9559651.1 glycine/betaine ABC transporter permease [Companilactobacillus kimchii]KRK53019.1 ABC proline glycine betaine transporter, permease and substrate binding protein [Companilactobacillus kimchii DSM 13961 = JCM 10707]OWF32155.1 Formylaminopyrimidine transport permease protein ThiX [Companilactobacillus kimchii]GEO47898.1 glycine/betaine ABC transporter permease [Companilactobacillus paralimentarius]